MAERRKKTVTDTVASAVSTATEAVTDQAPVVADLVKPARKRPSRAKTAVKSESSEPALDIRDRTPSEEDIRVAAYLKFESRARSGQPGSDFDDWVTAQNELLAG